MTWVCIHVSESVGTEAQENLPAQIRHAAPGARMHVIEGAGAVLVAADDIDRERLRTIRGVEGVAPVADADAESIVAQLAREREEAEAAQPRFQIGDWVVATGPGNRFSAERTMTGVVRAVRDGIFEVEFRGRSFGHRMELPGTALRLATPADIATWLMHYPRRGG